MAPGRGYCLFWADDIQESPDNRRVHDLIQSALGRAKRLTGVTDVLPVRVVLIPSRERMREIVGREANGMTLGDGVLLIVSSGDLNRLAIRHEMMHAVTQTGWGGRDAPSWIQEGLGVLAGGQCSGYTPRGAAALLATNGELIVLDTLAARFRTLDEIRAHLMAASFMQFVHETAGPAGLAALWRGGVAGLIEHGGAGTDPEAGWRGYLAATHASERPTSWGPLEGGCSWVEGAPDAA